jgi:hypothetical protein
MHSKSSNSLNILVKISKRVKNPIKSEILSLLENEN